MKLNISIYFIIILLGGCVEPPDYDDGLLENIPAIINADDYFSLSLYAENHTKNYNWNLGFSSTVDDTLLTSLIIKNYLGSAADSSTLILYNTNEAEIFNILLNGETTSISEISMEYIGNPHRLELISNKLNCSLELQLIRK